MIDKKAVMQMALDALTESVDLVNNEYIEAVELYSCYPSRLHRLTALKTALDAHNAAIDSLIAAIAQPEQPVTQADLQHVFETLYDHGNGKYRGAVSKAQRDKAIAICEVLEQSLTQPEQHTENLEKYLSANYPDAKGETLAERVIDALETMDIALGMKEIAQPEQPDQEPNAWRVTGTNRLYDQHEAEQEAKRCGGSAHAYPVYAEPQSVHAASERNFCSRCGKRLGGVEDVHTCTAPLHQKDKP